MRNYFSIFLKILIVFSHQLNRRHHELSPQRWARLCCSFSILRHQSYNFLSSVATDGNGPDENRQKLIMVSDL